MFPGTQLPQTSESPVEMIRTLGVAKKMKYLR